MFADDLFSVFRGCRKSVKIINKNCNFVIQTWVSRGLKIYCNITLSFPLGIEPMKGFPMTWLECSLCMVLKVLKSIKISTTFFFFLKQFFTMFLVFSELVSFLQLKFTDGWPENDICIYHSKIVGDLCVNYDRRWRKINVK